MLAAMSTPLITALRESCGYLSDDGYHQTARLMALAADEIERLTRQLEAPEAGNENRQLSRGAQRAASGEL
jgi:hypothetical protein